MRRIGLREVQRIVRLKPDAGLTEFQADYDATPLRRFLLEHNTDSCGQIALARWKKKEPHVDCHEALLAQLVTRDGPSGAASIILFQSRPSFAAWNYPRFKTAENQRSQ
jgi:hypothetical protein